MINKFKRGFTAEQAALVAMGLEKHRTIRNAEQYYKGEQADYMFECKAEHNNPFNDLPRESINEIDKFENEAEKCNEAKLIFEALLDEVCIACEWHDYLSGEVELYQHDIVVKPTNETLLEVFQIRRNAPDDEYSYIPLPNYTTITKQSLANWFYQHLPEKANLFDPTESYKNIDTGYSLDQLNRKEKTNVVETTTNLPLNFSEQITESQTWKNLYNDAEKALTAFEEWRSQHKNKNKIQMSQITEWLIERQKIKSRDAEFVKKILIEIFNL